jgi:hypothetical protein
MDTTQITSQSPRSDVAMLRTDDFFRHGSHFGQIVAVHRPRTDFPYRGPATQWDVDYVESPDDDAPVLHARIPAGTLVETWA